MQGRADNMKSLSIPTSKVHTRRFLFGPWLSIQSATRFRLVGGGFPEAMLLSVKELVAEDPLSE